MNNIENIENKNFECSICRELFFKPVSLACQHTFCSHCIENFKKSTIEAKCPLCRLYFFLPPNYNILLETLIKEEYLDEYKKRGDQIGEINQETVIRNRITTEILQSHHMLESIDPYFPRINRMNEFESQEDYNNSNFFGKASYLLKSLGKNVSNILYKNKDILKIISKYIKCQTQKCKNLGHEQYTFIHTNKSIYCKYCFNYLLDILYLM